MHGPLNVKILNIIHSGTILLSRYSQWKCYLYCDVDIP
jgi:hypothetical protein